MSDLDGLVLLLQSDRSEILEPFWLYFFDESCLYSKFDGLVALELRTSSLTNLLILRSFTRSLFLSYSDTLWASYPVKRFLFRYLLLSPQSLEREGLWNTFLSQLGSSFLRETPISLNSNEPKENFLPYYAYWKNQSDFSWRKQRHSNSQSAFCCSTHPIMWLKMTLYYRDGNKCSNFSST